MPSTSEVGHAKNVANFQDLISAVKGLGSKYNPSNSDLFLTNLNLVYNNADVLMDNVETANQSFSDGVGNRRVEFDPLKKLATRVVNAYNATKTTKQKKEAAQKINAKLQGQKLNEIKVEVKASTATSSTTPGPEQSLKTVSTSQQSYDQLVEHFSRLIAQVAADSFFNPNEADLKTAALNLKLTALKNSNSNFGNTFTTLTNTRIARNRALYEPETGLLDIAAQVKDYVLSIFSARAPEYRAISSIKFKNQKL
jgi:glutamyl/glutaminyl-tRNA synthetase